MARSQKLTLAWGVGSLLLFSVLWLNLSMMPFKANAQESKPFEITFPSGLQLKQGAILMADLETDPNRPSDWSVKFGDRKVPLFEQTPGHYEGIIGVPVDMTPGQRQMTLYSADGKPVLSKPITILDAHYPHQNIIVSHKTEGLKPLPGELETIGALKNTISSIRYWSKPLISPTPDCENSIFGVKRYHNGVYIHDYHKGVDLRSPAGRPIRAVAGGVVKIARMYRLHGGTVGIDHGQGLDSIYIHMSRIAAHPGEQVKQGDIIGYVGSTGFATGPHLHWGLYAGGIPVNPEYWIPVKHCS